MAISRRIFMSGGTGLAIASLAAACDRSPVTPASSSASPPAPLPQQSGAVAGPFFSNDKDWSGIRDQFRLQPDCIHMSAMLLSSHPAPVREAIERHREGLDKNPVSYLEHHMTSGLAAARQAAADYLGTQLNRIALTDNTTSAVGLTYNGLRLQPGDEILTTDQDYYVTFETLRQMSIRYGASVRTVALYDQAPSLGEEEAVARISNAITEATRLVALTWVHSSTGYKLPVRSVGHAIAELNASRPEARQILLGIDAVHGFGVENFNLADLACDFFMTGCHKWLFGPRGTGLIAAGPRGYDTLVPSIPSFIEQGGAFDAWYLGHQDPGPNNARRMTPGGFQAFEHKLALAEAFAWHTGLGKAAVAARTHELARHLKEELSRLRGVTVQTPLDTQRSSGIVAFDLAGSSAESVVKRLRDQGIIASVAPYATAHVRLTPSILNSHSEIERVSEAVRALA